MVPLCIQRGFNDFIYYAEKGSSGTDQIVYAVRAELVSGVWDAMPNQIHKIKLSIDSFAAQPKELISHVLLSATLSAASWSTVMEKLCHYILFFRL